MFQTGYLTIDREEVISGSYYYQLRYPNRGLPKPEHRAAGGVG